MLHSYLVIKEAIEIGVIVRFIEKEDLHQEKVQVKVLVFETLAENNYPYRVARNLPYLFGVIEIRSIRINEILYYYDDNRDSGLRVY